jgi:hypothetical protein
LLLTEKNTYPSSRQRLGVPPSSMTQAGFLSLAPGRALVSVTHEDVQALMEAVRKCPGHAAPPNYSLSRAQRRAYSARSQSRQLDALKASVRRTVRTKSFAEAQRGLWRVSTIPTNGLAEGTDYTVVIGQH